MSTQVKQKMGPSGVEKQRWWKEAVVYQVEKLQAAMGGPRV
jgi:hypothetical protein